MSKLYLTLALARRPSRSAASTRRSTFARTGRARHARRSPFARWAGGTVEAVDLGTGARPADRGSDHDLLGAVTTRSASGSRVAPASAHVAIPSAELVQPVDLGAHHVAVGTNYPAHAARPRSTDGPFLFPKLVAPTRPARVGVGGRRAPRLRGRARVRARSATLAARRPTPARSGSSSCNDYTDRETLLRHVDPWNPTSGQGLHHRQELPGLPAGRRALRRAARRPRLRRRARDRPGVNGELRQRGAHVAEALWDFDRMLARDVGASRRHLGASRRARVALRGAGGRTPGAHA